MEYKYIKHPDSKGSITQDGHTMFLDDAVKEITALQEQLKQVEERVSIYRNYLKKNGYGIQLHDIDKELALPKGE